MFYVLASLSLRLGKNLVVDFPCESPIDTSEDYTTIEPVPNMTLQQIIVLTRHGARSPISSYNLHETDDWYCDAEDDESRLRDVPRKSWSPNYYAEGGSVHRRNHLRFDKDLLRFKPSCKPGDLTSGGQSQHHELGEFFRRHYIEQMKFLPDRYDPRYVFIRSSEVERCQRSAMSLMSGLYPPTSADDIIEYETGTSVLEMLHPQKSQCKDLADAWDKWINSTEYKRRKERATPYLRPISDYFDDEWDKDEARWMFIGDWMGTVACTNHEFINPNVTDDSLKIGIDAVEFYSHGFYTTYGRGISGAPIMREILRNLENRLAGKTEYKFCLLSAHDVSIVAALCLLGYNNQHWAPFRSYFITEVWKAEDEQLYIRFIYNSKEVPVDFMDNKTLFKLSVFRSRVQKYIDYCHEFP
jgi:acid phosphatase